ncbi:uncharacterized protein TNIN_443691 [Trichonephila inaurata madagascariensis]|uniref:Apple domain-containing protein n=1 Tax=Trichonephila inaurata madagascariensis TaxID=2747483 RepID=A0A8X6I5A2_9ARAC|nr:uncharacterized protein TNIN_443691 [Trichonephila inaurata madagascariensis]
MELVPGTLRLTDCLALCSANATCQAINFETGLCVLFSSSASQRPAALTPSQFPVFTIYAHKVCLLGRKRCDRDWMFERVNGYELRDVARSSAIVMSREACMELCLNEVQFRCRSANYNRMTGECFLSDKDRTSLSLTSTNRYFGQSSESVDYLESNCVDATVHLSIRTSKHWVQWIRWMIQQSTMDIASRPHKQSNINKQLKFLCAEVAQTKLEPTDPKQKAFDRARAITGNSRSRSLATPDYFFRPLHQFVEDMLSGDVRVISNSSGQ